MLCIIQNMHELHDIKEQNTTTTLNTPTPEKVCCSTFPRETEQWLSLRHVPPQNCIWKVTCIFYEFLQNLAVHRKPSVTVVKWLLCWMFLLKVSGSSLASANMASDTFLLNTSLYPGVWMGNSKLRGKLHKLVLTQAYNTRAECTLLYLHSNKYNHVND